MEDYNYEYENATDVYDKEFMDCLPTSLPYSYIYLPALYFIMFFVGVSGNSFVVLVMHSKYKHSRPVDTFVVNLALADLVFVFTLPLWALSAMQDHHWAFGDIICKLSSFIIAVNRFSNIFFLTCMSMERYWTVVRMLDLRLLRSSWCVLLTCTAVWMLSFLLGVPSLVFRRVERNICRDDLDSPSFLGLSLFSFFLSFLLPVLVIIFCYSAILVKLLGHIGVGNARPGSRYRHSLKIVFTIITVFVVSWLPFNIFKTVLIGLKMQGATLSCSTQSLLARGLVLSSCLAFLNSCANPVIYLLLDNHFRQRASSIFQGCVGMNQRRVSSVSFSTGFSDSLSRLTTSRKQKCLN